MSILDRDALAASPLADLHALASELSIDGYRRLRKADLIDAILTRQGGAPAAEESDAESTSESSSRVPPRALESPLKSSRLHRVRIRVGVRGGPRKQPSPARAPGRPQPKRRA